MLVHSNMSNQQLQTPPAAADAHEGTDGSKTPDVTAEQKAPEDAQDLQHTEQPTVEINNQDAADVEQTHTPTEVQVPTHPANMDLDAEVNLSKSQPTDMHGITQEGACSDQEMDEGTSEQPSTHGNSHHQKIKKDKKHKEKSEKTWQEREER